MHLLVYTQLLWLLGSCASKPQRQLNPDTFNSLAFLYTSARYLMLKPCGCFAKPLGGVVREENQTKLWKEKYPDRQWIKVGSGPSFIPLQFYSKLANDYAKQSEKLVNAWNLLGMEALGISLADLRLGIERVKRLQKQSQFKFLSANIIDPMTHKRLFQSSWELEFHNKRLLVTAVSSAGTLQPNGISALALPPGESIQKVINEQNQNFDVLVVLASEVPWADITSALHKVTIPTIILGSMLDEEPVFRQPTGHIVLTGPINLGKVIERLELIFPPQSSAVEFYNPTLADLHLQKQNSVRMRIESLYRLLEQEKSRSKKSKLLSALHLHKRELAELQSLPKGVDPRKQIFLLLDRVELGSSLEPVHLDSEISRIQKDALDELFDPSH